MTRNFYKVMFLVISVLLVTAVSAKAGNPIPSYNFQLTKNANFQETNFGTGNSDLSKDRRDMNVSNDGPGSYKPGGNGSGWITVMIYRLDYSVMMGPYFVRQGQTLTVPIDGHPWGVYAHASHKSTISVWTSRH